MTDGIPLIHADDRIGASGMQPKSPFAPPPPNGIYLSQKYSISGTNA